MGVGDLLVAKFYVGKGLEEYISKLGNLEFEAPEAMGKAIFSAAELVADATNAALRNLPVDHGQTKSKNNHHVRRDLTTYEKQGLLDSFGISREQNDNGYINVKIGVDGYNGHVTKKQPKGAPNVAVARSLEKGTSFMRRNPVFSKTARAKKAEAERVMQETLDKEINKIMN